MAVKKKEAEEQTLEDVFKELENVMEKLKEEPTLEQSFQLYHQGVDLLKCCNDKIDIVEKKMMVLDADGEEHEF